MNILLLGHKGFIGQNIAEKMKVMTTDINLLNYNCLKDFVRDNDISTIINCAITHNLYQNMALLINVVRQPVERIILFGSGAQYNEYPKNPEYKKFKELQAELVRNDDRATNLVLYGVYGKYEVVEETFISDAIVHKLQKKKFHVRNERRMHYVYVDDVVRIVKHFTRYKGQHNNYDIVPEKSYLLSEIIKLITDNYSMGKERQYDYIGDYRRLVKELPKFRFTPIEMGIKHLTKYYEDLLH